MNSKKCLILSPFLITTAFALSDNPFQTLYFQKTESIGKLQKTSGIEEDIVELRQKRQTDFSKLIPIWREVYGKHALPILEKISQSKLHPDPDRYISILALAHLFPNEAKIRLKPYFKDESWMIRSAALKAAVQLKDKQFLNDITSLLLNDPALVVRADAAESLGKCGWPEAKEALLQSVYDSKNYHSNHFQKGIADWVPEKSLAALRSLDQIENISSIGKDLMPLVNEAFDPKIRAHALFTIEKIETIKLKTDGTFSQRKLAWNTKYFPKGIIRSDYVDTLQSSRIPAPKNSLSFKKVKDELKK